MDHFHANEPVLLDGKSLTLEQFIAVARFGAKVALTESARQALARSRALAEKISDEHRVAYGITTGFGDFATVAVPEEMSARLSTNLILSHAVGTGDPYEIEQVRGMMLLRANALCVASAASGRNWWKLLSRCSMQASPPWCPRRAPSAHPAIWLP